MSGLDRLLKVGSIAGSLGVYIPAVAAQKAMGLLRVLIFTYFLSKVEFGLWGLGMMIFNIAALVVTLGSNNGLVRYVSHYEARGRLEAFYRRARWVVLGLGLILTGVGLLGSEIITQLVFFSRDQAADVDHQRQLWICWAAIANGLFLALYHNMVSFMVGMRTYRLVAAIELFFGLLFTAFGIAGLLIERNSLMVLFAHAAALGVSLAVGMAMLHFSLKALARREPQDTPAPTCPQAVVMEPATDGEQMTHLVPVPDAGVQPGKSESERSVLKRLLGYGFASLLATLSLQAVGYLSFFLTSRWQGKAEGGVFHAFWLLSQPILVLANAAWAVIFTYAARHWETDNRKMALFVLEMSYKAVAVSIMTLTIAVYVTSPLWVRLLGDAYRPGRGLLGGLLLFFAITNHLALMTILAKLYERPAVIALAAVAAGAANWALAAWWMPAHGALGAAYAAGIGMYLGGGTVTLAYFLLKRVRFRPSTYFILGVPILLLLPAWAAAVAWGAMLLVAMGTTWIFSHQEKMLVRETVRNFRRSFSGQGSS